MRARIAIGCLTLALPACGAPSQVPPVLSGEPLVIRQFVRPEARAVWHEHVEVDLMPMLEAFGEKPSKRPPPPEAIQKPLPGDGTSF